MIIYWLPYFTGFRDWEKMITINLYPEGTYFRRGAANSKYQTIQCEKLDSGKTIQEGGLTGSKMYKTTIPAQIPSTSSLFRAQRDLSALNVRIPLTFSPLTLRYESRLHQTSIFFSSDSLLKAWNQFRPLVQNQKFTYLEQEKSFH